VIKLWIVIINSPSPNLPTYNQDGARRRVSPALQVTYVPSLFSQQVAEVQQVEEEKIDSIEAAIKSVLRRSQIDSGK